MPRRCSICSHPKTKQINEAICNSRSYRSIANQFNSTHATVMRHIETCLKMEMSAIIQADKERQAIDVHAEFEEQLEFAKDLRIAAKKWLLVADEIDLDPRSQEVSVVYLDYTDLTKKGEPKEKKAPLQELLNRAESAEARPIFSIVKTTDLRKFALDAINTTDTCIDKFAKLTGAYTQDQKNPRDVSQEMIEQVSYYFADCKAVGHTPSLNEITEWFRRYETAKKLPEGTLRKIPEVSQMVQEIVVE